MFDISFHLETVLALQNRISTTLDAPNNYADHAKKNPKFLNLTAPPQSRINFEQRAFNQPTSQDQAQELREGNNCLEQDWPQRRINMEMGENYEVERLNERRSLTPTNFGAVNVEPSIYDLSPNSFLKLLEFNKFN